jgi:hypothetical protein
VSIAAISASPPISTQASTAGTTPVRAAAPASSGQLTGSHALGPAVSLRIGPESAGDGSKAAQPEAESRGYVRDAESRSLVYQVVDPKSGDIVVQIPDAVVLKARTYAREAAASQSANAVARPGTTVEKHA